MRRLLAAVALGLLASPSVAHEIGVSQAELIEQEGWLYELRVETPADGAYLFGPPQLPEKCALDGNPRGLQAGPWRSYLFACQQSLVADDLLVLPWSRDGIMLTARWLSGFFSGVCSPI